MRFLAALISLALAPACATTQAFRPAPGSEHGPADTRSHRTGASIDLVGASGRFGEVTIWSDGARVAGGEASKQTVVHIGITLENGLAEPISLDLATTRLASIQAGDRVLEKVGVTHVDGEPEVPAESVGTVHLEFALPEAVAPKTIESFRLYWAVRAGEELFRDFAAFEKAADQRRYPLAYACRLPWRSFDWYPLGYTYCLDSWWLHGPWRPVPRVVIVRPRPHRGK